jgi:hypothetical protein
MSCPKEVEELAEVWAPYFRNQMNTAGQTINQIARELVESDGNRISVSPDSTGGIAIDLLAPELSDD